MPTPPAATNQRAQPAAREGRALHKGQQTKLAIVDAALGLATQIGLEGLSIGVLAEVTGMSKSGVFAHFGSREELQISVIREYFSRFEQEIFYPALQQPRGLPRLQALFANWMKRVTVEIQSGCIFISGAVDFDDRPGPGARRPRQLGQDLAAPPCTAPSCRPRKKGSWLPTPTKRQIGFEIHGLILAVHYEARFLKTPGSIARANKAFEQILARYGREAKTVKAPSIKAAAVKTSRKSTAKSNQE